MSTPLRIEPPKEHRGCRNAAANEQWRCGWSEICRAEVTCHTLEVRVAIGRAIKPEIRRSRRLRGLRQLDHLAARSCRVFCRTGGRIPDLSWRRRVGQHEGGEYQNNKIQLSHGNGPCEVRLRAGRHSVAYRAGWNAAPILLTDYQ